MQGRQPAMRTDSIYDLEQDLRFMDLDCVREQLPQCPGDYCFSDVNFYDGWIPRTCLSRSAWLMVRAVAPNEAGVLSLFVVLRKTRCD